MKTKKVKRKRLNVARTLVFILFIYIIICFGISIYKEPVHHYEIKGNKYITDAEILRYLKLTDYPSFISINTGKIRKKLEKKDEIIKAKVKYSFNFTLKITIEENIPVFYVKTDDKICLKDGTLVDNNKKYVGIPTLLNETPNKIRKELANNFSELDDGILYTISEIEYSPSYNSEGQVIDNKRFLLSMNDQNMVYITSKKANLLNKYLDVIATNQITSNGTLFLDGDEDNYTFKIPSKEEKKEVKEDTKKEKEETEAREQVEEDDGHEE